MKTNAILLILIFLFYPFGAPAQERDSTESIHLRLDSSASPPAGFLKHPTLAHPRVGLALSGGGARGIAQIGVIAVLEENDIPIDYLVGTSIGSIIGGLYASGYSPAELLALVKSIKWQDILLDTTSRSGQFIGKKEERNRHLIQLRLSSFKPYFPTAFTPGQKLSMLLSDLVLKAPYHANNFHDLAIPLEIVTTDMIKGNKVILTEGNLAEAMRASSAIPLLFEPVEKDSMLLIDGGLLSNIPVAEVRRAPVDLVIAVNTTSPLRRRTQIQLPWEIADQVTSIMQQENNRIESQKADFLITLQQKSQENIDFSAFDSLYQQGREEALKLIPAIKEKLAQLQFTPQDSNRYWLEAWSVTGLHTLNRSDLDSMITIPDQDTISGRHIRTWLETIYNSGYFQNATARLHFKVPSRSKNLPAIRLELILAENPPLKAITFSGNRVLSDSMLRAQIKSRLDWPINHRISKQDLRALIRSYRDHGYSLACPRASNYNPNTGALHIAIDEGIITDIVLTGTESVRDYVILRELTIAKGQVFNHADAQTGIKNIFGTGLFSFVIQDLVPTTGGYKLILHLKSQKYDLVRMGGRYDRERENRFFIEFANQNVFGTGNPLSFHAQYGNRDLVFALDFRTDRIFSSYLSSNLSAYYSKSRYYSYTALDQVGEYEIGRKGVNFSLGQQIERLGNVSLFLRLENVAMKSRTGLLNLNDQMTLKTVGLVSKVDTRDKVPYPNSGKYHVFQYDFNFDRKNRFFKFYNSITTFYSIFKNHTVIPRLAWGTSELTTPFVEQFKLGGHESMYGLRENQMNGRHLFLASLEYRLRLPLKLLFDTYLSGRYDFGTVWRSHEDIKPRELIQGVGLGLAIDSIIGPVELAVGRNSTGRHQYYVNIGHNF